MKVKFRRQFFGPDAKRYKAGEVHDVPDQWADELVLPTGTEILAEAIPSEEETDDALHDRKMRARNISAAAAERPRRMVAAPRTPDAEGRVAADGTIVAGNEPDPTRTERDLNARARTRAVNDATEEEIASRAEAMKDSVNVLGPRPPATPAPPPAAEPRAVKESLLGVDRAKDPARADIRDVDEDTDVDNLDDAEGIVDPATRRTGTPATPPRNPPPPARPQPTRAAAPAAPTRAAAAPAPKPASPAKK